VNNSETYMGQKMLALWSWEGYLQWNGFKLDMS